MLHPARLRENLAKLLLRGRHRLARTVEENRPRTGGALVEAENVGGHLGLSRSLGRALVLGDRIWTWHNVPMSTITIALPDELDAALAETMAVEGVRLARPRSNEP